jgi:NTE family protein
VSVTATPADRTRIALVLSAGGLRGAAHVGVLRALVREGVGIDVLVGVSAGAVIAAYYAGAGLTLDELADDAVGFRGRHLLLHSANVRLGRRFERTLAPHCGIIPQRLRRLEAATFDTLHHSISALGIGCHDVRSNRPRYFATGATHGVPLHEVVKASASIPFLFPRVPVVCDGEPWLLTDGGISDPVPIAFARAAPLCATHVIVSDARWIGTTPRTDERTIWIRPRMPGTGTLWTRRGLAAAVRCGEAAVTAEVVSRIPRSAERPRPIEN